MQLVTWALVLVAAAPALANTDERTAAGRAVGWLMQQQDSDHGWRTETGKAVIALTLANFSAPAVEQELILKQLQINLLVDIWGRKEYPLTTGRIAEYVLALVGLCFDVTSFHGKDLTAILRRHRGVMDYESAFVVLATCAAGVPPHRRSYSKLIGITHDSDDLHGTDTLALAVLALRCVQQNTFLKVQRHLEAPLRALAARQQPDGRFGNFHSTILAVQALRAAREPGWNETAAVQYLLSHQQPDGSFGNSFDTTQVLPVLVGRNIGDVSQTACHSRAQPDPVVEPTTPAPRPPTAPPGTSAAPPRQVNFTFWLWVGKPPNSSRSIELSVPHNTSMYDSMKLAAERDPHYEFSATVWPNGHYVHTIGGLHESKVGYQFWLLYRLPTAPDLSAPPANAALSSTGIDDLYPTNGEHILFWYKKI